MGHNEQVHSWGRHTCGMHGRTASGWRQMHIIGMHATCIHTGRLLRCMPALLRVCCEA